MPGDLDGIPFTPTGPNEQTMRLAGEPLPVPSGESTSILDSTPAPPRWPLVPGYVIVGELGRGGMGVVYRARQDRLNRTVAVKMLLNEQFADVTDVVRFRSEAEAVAAVVHPHVVKVYESGQHDGRPFFVMEYLSGGTLHAKLRATAPLPPDAAGALAEKLARAVHAAHQQGIIHRDLKPGNVLFDADGEPRVTDFGLAKRSSQELTKTQVVMGTPAYMPPEQAAGRAKYAGPPADIYALGVILYEALTGHTPFTDADSVVMMARVISEPPASPRSKVAGIPHDLELICLKCLEKEPGDRYPTAAALADDLRRYLNREPVSIRPAGPIEKAVKWARRRPTLASAYGLGAAAAVLLLFGGVVSALWLQAEHARRTADVSAIQADQARHEANTNWQLAEKARGELAGRNGELVSTLGRETVAKTEAEKARREADTARADLQRLAYFRDVGLAYSEAKAGNVRRANQLLAACPKDARGWEWHFTDRLANPQLRAIECRFGPTDVAYTKDGLCLFEPNGLMIPVDGAGKRGKAVQVAPLWRCVPFCVSPDGSRYVGYLQPDDKKLPARLAVWRTSDGKELGSWSVPNSFPLLMTAANGGRIVAGFAPDKLMAFDPAEKEPLWVLDDLVTQNHSPNLSADGNWLVVDSLFDMAVVDVTQGKVAYRAPYAGGRVSTSAVSPDGKRLVVGDYSGQLSWFARGEKKATRVTMACAGGVNGVTFSPDGKRVACGGHDGTVRVYAAESAAELAVFRGHSIVTAVLQFNPSGTELTTSAEDLSCFSWAVDKPNAAAAEWPVPADLPDHVRLSPDLTRLFAHSWEEKPRGVMCDPAGGGRINVPPPPRNFVHRFEFQPGGKGFACGTGNGGVDHWPDPAGPSVRVAQFDGAVERVEYSADGRMLLSAGGRRVSVWDTVAKKEVWRSQGELHHAALSPDGKRVVACYLNKFQTIDLPGGRAVEWEGVHTVGAFQFTPDSAGLLVGELNWGVCRYTLGSDGKPSGAPQHYKGHSAMVQSVALSADGKRLAAGGEDGVVKVWDAASGQEVLGLTVRDRKPVKYLFFATDGRLVAGTEEGPPVVYDGRPRAAKSP